MVGSVNGSHIRLHEVVISEQPLHVNPKGKQYEKGDEYMYNTKNMSYYEKVLYERMKRNNNEYNEKSWTVPQDNNGTGESAKKYYQRHGYV